ncbi:hypothetical protein T12_11978, partial [Trichinella patagoniensis]
LCRNEKNNAAPTIKNKDNIDDRTIMAIRLPLSFSFPFFFLTSTARGRIPLALFALP